MTRPTVYLTSRDLEREPFTALALGPNVLAFDDGTLARLADGHAKAPPGADAPASPPRAPGAAVRADAIVKRYGGRSVLDGVAIEIEPGGFVAIVGRSGCGKSTLLRILAGLLDYEVGRVALDGQPIHGTRRDVGVVFQSSILLPWRSVLENVMLPAEVLGLDKKQARERAMQLLHMVRLEGFEHKLPRQLSGGMQQRASIARALLHDPKILLMDEPFGALDAMTRERMNLELQRIWMESGKTVVLITHSIPEAVFLGDKVFVMSPRPGTLERVLPIDLPRPRTMEAMSHPAFASAAASIRERFSHAASFD